MCERGLLFPKSMLRTLAATQKLQEDRLGSNSEPQAKTQGPLPCREERVPPGERERERERSSYIRPSRSSRGANPLPGGSRYGRLSSGRRDAMFRVDELRLATLGSSELHFNNLICDNSRQKLDRFRFTKTGRDYIVNILDLNIFV